MRKQKQAIFTYQVTVENALAAYVASSLNGVQASERNEYLCDCPQCGKRKFYVNVVSGLAHCFHADCLYSAHLAKLLQDTEGCSKQEAYKKANALRDGTGFGCSTQYKKENEIETRTDTLGRFTTYLAKEGLRMQTQTQTKENETQTQCELPSGCVPITSQYAKRAVNYLQARGVAKEVMLDYELQFCMAPRIHGHERYRSHIVFPFYAVQKDNAKKLVYWTTRRTYETTDKHLPKSYHPSQSIKSKLLNATRLRNTKEVYLVEGPMDMLAFPYNAIPLLGSTLSHTQALALCKRYKKITIMLDSDAHHARLRLAQQLLGLCRDTGKELFAYVPETDPADMMLSVPDHATRCAIVWQNRIAVTRQVLQRLIFA